MPVEAVKITDDGVVVVFSDGNCCDCNDDDDYSCGDTTCPVCNPTRKE